jgi:uncharacterized protein YcbK (DUF882 family)
MTFDLNLKLSKNFSLGEFKVSKTYAAMAYTMQFQYHEVLTLKLLCLEVLQPIRYQFNKPVMILSGKRSERLNRLVGGSENSDHLTCNAADIVVQDVDSLLVYSAITQSNIPYRQAIYYKHKNFVHVSSNIPIKGTKHEHFIVD